MKNNSNVLIPLPDLRPFLLISVLTINTLLLNIKFIMSSTQVINRRLYAQCIALEFFEQLLLINIVLEGSGSLETQAADTIKRC